MVGLLFPWCNNDVYNTSQNALYFRWSKDSRSSFLFSAVVEGFSFHQEKSRDYLVKFNFANHGWVLTSYTLCLSSLTTLLLEIFRSSRTSNIESPFTRHDSYGQVWTLIPLFEFFAEVEFVAAFFRICLYIFLCKIFSILIIFLRWLQVVLVICCSRFTCFTNELYIILMMAFAKINYFSKFN